MMTRTIVFPGAPRERCARNARERPEHRQRPLATEVHTMATEAMPIRTLIPPWRTRLKLLRAFKSTHPTGGLPGFPAIDLFAKPGTKVQVPETCELVWPHFIEWSEGNASGGWTCYLHGVSGDTYFCTHFGMLAGPGTYAAGEIIGTVAAVPHGWWAPHIHEGKHEGRYDPGV